jgi:hypothetical protein
LAKIEISLGHRFLLCQASRLLAGPSMPASRLASRTSRRVRTPASGDIEIGHTGIVERRARSSRVIRPLARQARKRASGQ